MASVSVSKSKGSQCYAINCCHYNNSYWRGKGITFHKFPDKNKFPGTHADWVKKCRREKDPSKYAVLCSFHFEEKWFDRTGQTVRLREGAIPDPGKFNLPQDLQEHAYAGSPSKQKRKFLPMSEKRDVKARQYSHFLHREKRAKKTCRAVVQELYEKNLINAELEVKLQSYGDVPVELFGRPSKEYSIEQRDFALTLNLHSSKAYTYLRETMHISLPNPMTLRRWMESVDASPGINLQILETLQQKRIKNPDQYTRVCLMLDTMSVRRHIAFDTLSKKFHGYEDLGCSSNTTTDAKEALVFMIVGLTAGWKAPFAYFLPSGLTAEYQSQLVKHTLEKLHECGFEVCAITMDGHPSKVAMCKLLGAKVDQLDCAEPKTWIESPQGHRTYVMFDAYHMAKLMWNTFQAYGALMNTNGEVISWRFVSDLHKMQDARGLRPGNRLMSKFIDFHQQKIKVSMATRVFSMSVANAIRTLKEIDKTFKDSEPTAEFIERMDHLVDVLNSHSPLAKGYKSPLTSANLQSKKAFLLESRDYLLNLKMVDGQPLSIARRGTCVKNFVVLIDSVLRLADDLIAQKKQKYLLTYKMSQDHLEFMFNAIRCCGGWNNNPTAESFTSAFRKIIAHRGGFQVSSCGNCTPLYDMQLVHLSTAAYCPPTRRLSAEDEVSLDPFAVEELALHDHSYATKSLSLFIENVAVCAAGRVICKIFRTLTCETCRQLLVTHQPSPKYKYSYTLLKLKQCGGHVVPSDWCIRVISSAEKHLRRLGDAHAVANASVICLQSCVVADVGMKVFCDDHACETQVGIFNHKYCLIREIVAIYYNLRQHPSIRYQTTYPVEGHGWHEPYHMLKMYNLKLQGRNLRHTLTKTIFFTEY